MAAKNEAKTKPTQASVDEFLAASGREAEARQILALMKKVTRQAPTLWGPSIVGFGSYRYTYASGKTGDWPITGFSPRKAALVVYIMPGFAEYDELLGRLGKHATGKSCLYIKKLADVDLKVLEELIRRSVAWMKEKYPAK